jgi:hypothetical protein
VIITSASSTFAMRFTLGPRFKHVAVILLAAGALAAATRKHVDGSGDRSLALARALKQRGLLATPDDVRWVDPPKGLRAVVGTARAIVRAHASEGEPNDLYLVETKLSPEGVLLSVGDAYDLTETSGADESRPIVKGSRVAYVASPLMSEGKPTFHVLDLAGQPALGGDWTWLEREQNALMNLQQVGSRRGVGKRTFALAEGSDHEGDAKAAKDASVDLDGDELVIKAQGAVARVSLVDAKAKAPAWLRGEEIELAKPGNLVTWSVDRVRAVSWIGDDNMQTVKAIVFTALDVVKSNKAQVTGDTGEKDIAADLGKTDLDQPTRVLPVDPEIGWPPAPLEAFVVPTLSGEGQWNALDHDAYVRTNPGLPPAFLTTFIRSDNARKDTRVYVALWDPRQIELHMMAGTVEPKSASGEAGPGLIPRTPEVMKRVVAASNAGFQAMHGEFGMMADGVVYLPPKPYGATVAVTRDGSTGFGTWPQDQTIPENILSYRQNMTVLVQDQKFNPYGRTWWGGTPPGWADKTHTVRTGICLTKEHFVAYFYGADISPEALAQAMIQTRCSFGLALDMNAGHSGLEFYKVAPANEFEALSQPLQMDWQAEGDVPGLDGWKFRGRRLIRGMGLMHFPRYIRREARDFFYMTLRHVLPGEPIASGQKKPEKEEGEWRVKGLPQHGFPYAMALTEVRPDAAKADLKLRVLKVDPRTVSAAPASKATTAKTVLVVDAGAEEKGEALALWHSTGSFSIGNAAPVSDAVRLASGRAAGAALAGAGVSDEDGMLLYVEVDKPAAEGTADQGKAIDELLKKLGCSTRMLLPHPLALALGGDTSLEGAVIRAPSTPTTVRLARAESASAKRLFEDTPVVPLSVWYPLQQQRIRYFKKPQGAEDAAGDDK